MNIVSRGDWGARPWLGRPVSVSFSRRTEFMVHYHGDPPRVAIGPEVPRDCEAIHVSNGWMGVGYNFIVDQAGTAYEGRGWALLGAHCPLHNISAFGVYVAVGGSQEPSPAALATVRALYDEACRLTGTRLRMTWHGANYATECPGVHLIEWVKAGMPAPAEEENDMPISDDDVDRIVKRMLSADFAMYKARDGDLKLPITEALTDIINKINTLTSEVVALKAKLPVGQSNG